jgi:phospholipid/cholesterol/gamma-HCH transport system substrate-binding protein
MGRNNHALVTGIFLAVLISSTIAIIYWIGNFDKQRNDYVISTRAAVSGLVPESTVFYRGIAVGKVKRIQFDPADSGVILIPIEIDKNIVLTKGVFAILQIKGVTGLTQIEIEDSGKIDVRLPPGNNPQYRIPLLPSLTDKLMNRGGDILKKAEVIMDRLNLLLNKENTENIGEILGNLARLTAKLGNLQQSVDKAFREIPVLSKDASKTLKHIDALTLELKQLSKELAGLSQKTGKLVDAGSNSGTVLMQTTLPKVNELLNDLQATTLEVKKMTIQLENNPQALLLGPVKQPPGPGEPGFKVRK